MSPGQIMHMGGKEKVLVALGGNAILRHKEKGTAEEQFENVRQTCRHMVELIKEGYRIAITHGNGPQVGDILLKNELSKDTLPPMPLDVCGAESQGMLGYMIQQSMDIELRAAGMNIPTQTILTQTLVDEDDPAFQNPTKPIGPFYTALEAARLREKNGWKVVNDSGRGYRRVVPSPNPVSMVESASIKDLFDHGFVVIASGGGGVPVIRDKNGRLRGIDAVIDKDHSAAVFAKLVGADTLMILTDVEAASLNFGRPDQQNLSRITVAEAKKYIEQGQFAPGSMKPKVESAVQFVEFGGKRAIITSIDNWRGALKGETGTQIVP
jgi:carbamate kinase